MILVWFMSQSIVRKAWKIEEMSFHKGVDAIGVGVTVEYEGMKQYKQMISNNGAAQSERSLHFGIGKRDNVAKLTIHWASGDKVYVKIQGTKSC